MLYIIIIVKTMTTEKDVVNSSPTTISNANLPKTSSKATQSTKESFYSVLAKTPYPAWAMSALCTFNSLS